MTGKEFRAQAEASAATVMAALEADPADARARWLATLYLELGATPTPALVAARRAFVAWRAEVGEAAMAEEARRFGALALLVKLWNGLGESHYDGAELDVFADWLIALAEGAKDLESLPYGVGNWNGSWMQVGKHAAAACEKLAAATLARDPDNESALYLYAQADFLASVNRSRPRGKKITGPPVPKPTGAQAVAKIERILRRFVKGDHPLDIESMDPIAVDSAEVVEALIAGLGCAEYRGGLKCVHALGRAKVELPRVIEAFTATLSAGDQRFVDEVAMAVHYGLKERGVELLAPLIAASERLIASLRKDNASDYRHRWALTAVLTLARFCRGAAKTLAEEYLRRLLVEVETMPAWKQERLYEFRAEAPALLTKLGR